MTLPRPESFECNGARAVISQNLHSALSRLRDRHAPLLLWVDAICIDQRLEPMSLREREKQVRMMDKIYSQAQKVYVGLGDAGGEMERLIPFLSTFDAIPNDFYSEPNTIMGILAEFDFPKVEDPAWADYAQFMTRPWFSRVWIMQEFILAREVVVFAGMQNFGYEFLDWLVFAGFQYRKVMEAYIQAWLMKGENRGELIKSLLPAIREGHGNLFRIMQTRRERLEGESDYRDFCNYLSSSKSFGATDNRDRAYALLGLATDVDPSTFPVSYSESTEEVSMRVARYLIQNGDGVYALYTCVGINDRCPSWAFDLPGGPPSDALTTQVDTIGSSRLFWAKGDSKPSMMVDSDESLLKVTGFMFGRITNMTSIHTAGDELNWTLDVSRWIEELQTNSTGQFEPMACWHAAFADCIQDSWGQTRRSDEGPEIEDDLEAFISSANILRTYLGNNRIGEDLDSAFEPIVLKMLPIFKSIAISRGRRLACTTDGMVCLVPGNAQVGDNLSIFHGAPIPFVLRKEDDHFRIVGSAYVHDMMDGQAFETDKWKAEDIVLR